MKSPADIGHKLARQWHQSSVRAERLLNSGSWPLCEPIGKPLARTFAENTHAVQRHVESWRQVSIGKVEWETISYRAGLEPISIPVQWILYSPSDWIKVAADLEISRQYAQLERIVESVDEAFHFLLVSQRGLWLKKDPREVVAAAALASRLTPGCAEGRPLRLLAEYRVDTKFFERNAALLAKLLDERFEGEVSEQGLTTFLDAYEENGHWVLVAPLSSGLLPYKQLKVTTAELLRAGLPCSRVLAVENEKCIHLLPELPDTIAVLGAGLDLGWLAAPALAKKAVGYWGDMDTWGLKMLARARCHQPDVTPLLMSQPLFDEYASDCAVIEPVTAQNTPPEGLSFSEAEFYRYLLTQEHGRLEQEYLPRDQVEAALANWMSLT